MKKLGLLLILLNVFVGFAQRPNGGMRNQSSTRQERPKFESTTLAGFIEYAPKKVIKKLKLNKKDTLAKSVSSALEQYNVKIASIKAKHKDLLEGLDIVVNQNMEIATRTRNRELIQSTMGMVQDKLAPIRNEVKAEEDKLNVFFEGALTDENYQSWLAYQKSEHKKLVPKRRVNDARNRPDNLNGGQRRRG